MKSQCKLTTIIKGIIWLLLVFGCGLYIRAIYLILCLLTQSNSYTSRDGMKCFSWPLGTFWGINLRIPFWIPLSPCSLSLLLPTSPVFLCVPSVGMLFGFLLPLLLYNHYLDLSMLLYYSLFSKSYGVPFPISSTSLPRIIFHMTSLSPQSSVQ